MSNQSFMNKTSQIILLSTVLTSSIYFSSKYLQKLYLSNDKMSQTKYFILVTASFLPFATYINCVKFTYTYKYQYEYLYK